MERLFWSWPWPACPYLLGQSASSLGGKAVEFWSPKTLIKTGCSSMFLAERHKLWVPKQDTELGSPHSLHFFPSCWALSLL
jgi:hypothetical protein